MNFLAVVTPPTAIYSYCYTQRTLYEEHFAPVNMTSCGKRNVKKHRWINDGDQYIVLDISSKLDFWDKMEVTAS